MVGVASEDCGHGAKVLWVLPGGAAERAGLRVGDKVSIIRACWVQIWMVTVQNILHITYWMKIGFAEPS